MRLETTARQLRSGLRLLAPIIERRTAMPVLECVLIDGNTLRGTNLDQELSVTIATSKADGSIAIAYRGLAALAGMIPPDDVVKIEAGTEGATISFPGGRYDLLALPADTFPNPAVKDVAAAGAALDTSFSTALRFVAPCISNEETRYYLNGFCISRDGDGRQVLVTTDGHRMAVHPAGFDLADADGTIIPIGAVKPLLRMAAPERFDLFGTRVRFAWPGITLTTKTIEGTFPDWKRVVPKVETDTTTVTLPLAGVVQALKRIGAAVGSDRFGRASVLAFWDDVAVLEAHNPDGGAALEYLAGVSVANATGPQFIGFNARYLAEAAKLFGGSEKITLTIKDAGNTARITSSESEAFGLLMPMRVDADKALAALGAPEQTKAAA